MTDPCPRCPACRRPRSRSCPRRGSSCHSSRLRLPCPSLLRCLQIPTGLPSPKPARPRSPGGRLRRHYCSPKHRWSSSQRSATGWLGSMLASASRFSFVGRTPSLKIVERTLRFPVQRSSARCAFLQAPDTKRQENFHSCTRRTRCSWSCHRPSWRSSSGSNRNRSA